MLSPGPETPVDEAAIPYGTSVARPTMAPAEAARSHDGEDLNTPHAARVNNARLATAPALAIAHAGPPGGLLVPANDAVIHMNVLAYSSSVTAATLRRVQRRFAGRSLVLAFGIFWRALVDRIAVHPTGACGITQHLPMSQ